MATPVTEPFGKTPAGETVHRIVIAGGGLTAHILTFGATLQDLRFEGHPHPLVLGFPTFAPYLDQSPYFGATVGRYSNRIAHGRFVLDGRTHTLDLNENGRHHLHGGSEGAAWRPWTIAAVGADHVTLTLECADGAMGYPGTASLRTTYHLCGDGTLALRHETLCDRQTPASLTHHSYFALDDAPTIRNLDLEIDADHYLPIDENLIPTGEIRSVEAPAFDFRTARPIGQPGAAQMYDHNFCLSHARVPKRPVARLSSRRSGIAMAVATSEPGLQFYDGAKIATASHGLTDRPYGPFAGLCLETQAWPDAPNQAHFPTAVIAAGERLVQETDYRFFRP